MVLQKPQRREVNPLPPTNDAVHSSPTQHGPSETSHLGSLCGTEDTLGIASMSSLRIAPKVLHPNHSQLLSVAMTARLSDSVPAEPTARAAGGSAHTLAEPPHPSLTSARQFGSIVLKALSHLSNWLRCA
jgi:hypothetical protein